MQLAFIAAFAVISLSAEAKLRYPTGLELPEGHEYGVTYMSIRASGEALPTAVDLRSEGLVTSVKNQGSCGSCWAFAGAAVMESHVLGAGGLEDLSEQELVSCDRKRSFGCSGGWEPFQYMIDHGIGAEADFPYAGRNLRCRQIDVVAKAVQWGRLGKPRYRPTAEEVKTYLALERRPLWVTVSAGSGWNRPGPVKTRCGRGRTNHAVTAVGYEPAARGDSNFIIKNSWGEAWNGDGYVKAPHGCDSLNEIASFVATDDSVLPMPRIDLPAVITARKGQSFEEALPSAFKEHGVTVRYFQNGRELARGHDAPLSEGDVRAVVETSYATFERLALVVLH